MDSPLLQISLIILIGYLFKIWFSDFRNARKGQVISGALPGALPINISLVIAGIVGAVVFVMAETWGEIFLEISSEQIFCLP